MLQNLKKYFYKNKVQVLRNILIVVFAIIVIQLLNNAVRENSLEDNKKYQSEFSYGNLIQFSNSVTANNILNGSIGNNNQIGNIGNNIVSENNSNYIQNTIINNPNSSQNDNVSNSEKIIQVFLDNCIKGDINQAYEMISDECKSLLFPNIEQFRSNYYAHIFGGQKEYNIEYYLGNTYKVRVAENMNSTGSYTALANEDYITVQKIEDKYKININNYIGRKNINKTTTQQNVKITVNYKDVFKNYERYNVTVENNNEKIIMLDTKSSTDTMYLLGNNDIKYYAYGNEIIDNSLILKGGSIVNLNIKYKNTYTLSTNTIKYLIFSDVILDYDLYRNLDNKLEYNKVMLRVNI